MPEMKGVERRAFPVELRVAGDEGKMPRIEGHAAVFDQLSEELWGFRERVLPGCFRNSIGLDDVRCLFNHDPNYVLGRNKSGTLSLEEDGTGLAIVNDPPDTQWARDLLISMQRGDISQMSFAFLTLRDNWLMEGGIVVRELIEVKLFDVSPVTYPAYPQTDVGARALAMAMRSGDAALVQVIERARGGQAMPDDVARIERALEALKGNNQPSGSQAATTEGARAERQFQAELDVMRMQLEIAKRQ